MTQQYNKAAAITPSDTANITVSRMLSVTGAEQTATAADLSANTITKASNGLANGDQVLFVSIGSITGITAGVIYYVVNVSGNDFKVAATMGGTAIDLTGATTTLPIFQQVGDLVSGIVMAGAIYVGADGDVTALPEGHENTNVTTPGALGAVLFKAVKAGTVIPGKYKKVFSTGTTASMNLQLLYND